MGKGQRKRQRKRLAKRADDAKREAKRQRQQQQQPPSQPLQPPSADSSGGSAAAAAAAASARPAEQIALIRAYHTIEKRLAAVDRDPGLTTQEAREGRRRALCAEREALGGLDAYQRASIAGESSSGPSAHQVSAADWVLQELRGRPLTATHKAAQRTAPLPLPRGADTSDAPPLRLLDVGAIVNHYPPDEPDDDENEARGVGGGGGGGDDNTAGGGGALRGPTLPGGRRLHVTSIDINPQSSEVIRSDFFDFARAALAARAAAAAAAAAANEVAVVGGGAAAAAGAGAAAAGVVGCYDVVVLSLVLNFVGDPRARGEMLRLTARLLDEGGYLFLVCVRRRLPT
jgi:hypothetical protein